MKAGIVIRTPAGIVGFNGTRVVAWRSEVRRWIMAQLNAGRTTF
jgi:hypothetical protein